MSGKGSVAGFLVPAALYIESRPWAHISRSWGDIYILLLLVYMVNFHCDYTSIYIYIYIYVYSSCLLIFGVFARQVHSTSEFAMIVLSKCVIHAGFVMVA